MMKDDVIEFIETDFEIVGFFASIFIMLLGIGTCSLVGTAYNLEVSGLMVYGFILESAIIAMYISFSIVSYFEEKVSQSMVLCDLLVQIFAWALVLVACVLNHVICHALVMLALISILWAWSITLYMPEEKNVVEISQNGVFHYKKRLKREFN